MSNNGERLDLKIFLVMTTRFLVLQSCILPLVLMLMPVSGATYHHRSRHSYDGRTVVTLYKFPNYQGLLTLKQNSIIFSMYPQNIFRQTGVSNTVTLYDHQCWIVEKQWWESGAGSLKMPRGCLCICQDHHCQECDMVDGGRHGLTNAAPMYIKSMKLCPSRDKLCNKALYLPSFEAT